MRSLFVLALLGTHAAHAATADALRAADARSPIVVADAASPDTSDSSLRQRAEDLARAASQRFSEILSTDNSAPKAGTDKAPANSDSKTFAPVWNWLARASKDYQDVVIGKLKSPDGWVVVVQRADAPTPVPVPDKQVELQPAPRRGWSGLLEIVRDWLARANRAYRTEIVKPLVEPSTPEPAKATAQESTRAAPPPASPPGVAPAPTTPARPVVVEAPQAKPDTVEAKAKADAEAQIKRDAEAADAKRKADIEAETRRDAAAAAQAKRAAEAAAEAKRRFDAEADTKRKADAEAEAKRVAEAADAKRKADAEVQAKRKAAAAEARRQSDAEAEAKRKAEDAKRLAEEGDAERKAVAEAEATRLATEAEEKRKVEREAKVRRAVQAATEAAAANVAPAGAKEAAKTENSGIAPGRNAETSEHTPAAAAPEKSAAPSSAPDRPARTASPDTSKPSETVAEEPLPPKVPPEATSKKRELAQVDTGRKQAHARRHKPVHAKHRKHGYGAVYAYKTPRALPVEAFYPGPRCKRQCRCAGDYGYRHAGVAKPRKRVVWRGYAAPRVYASEAHVLRSHRVHHRHAVRASLTYRHHRLYIPSQTY